ncbi:dihydrofolate reductase family protein [Cytobacillus sp. FJAT-54145]|uniref:Dihydrofolate reductase family protein n=1 Tax=Cytobacillus spartinae TaxID=3299023 RepID=A0ABW6K7D4_9BACI
MKESRKVVLYIATSLDGFIAAEDESLDWLFRVEGEGDNGYSAFYETVDTILMGRKTFDWVMQHENGNFPYANKECYVFTKSVIQDSQHVKFINEDIVSFTNHLKSRNGKNIWIVGGGGLLQTFLKEKLVDELIITVAPALIGKGIPLFREGDYEIELSLKGFKQYNQFGELHYEVKR